jgi:hypothetical protein
MGEGKSLVFVQGAGKRTKPMREQTHLAISLVVYLFIFLLFFFGLISE